MKQIRMQKCKCARFNFRFSWAKQSVPLVFPWSVKSETQTELFPASPNVPVEPKARRFIVFLLVSLENVASGLMPPQATRASLHREDAGERRQRGQSEEVEGHSVSGVSPRHPRIAPAVF